MVYTLSIIKENGESSVASFPNYKTAKLHYGRIINERNTVHATLKDDSPKSRVRLSYDRGMLK